MLQTAMNVMKWASIPILLTGAIFSSLAATYEPIMDTAIFLLSLGLVLWQARLKNYYCAAGFFAVGLVFSPLPLVEKIFFLMGLTCLTSLLTVAAAFRMEPAPGA
jgi:hypothetical protein